MKNNIVLITGAAGFIGSKLTRKFIQNGFKVIGIDNLNSYYDISLKKRRIQELIEELKPTNDNWKFYKDSLEDFYKMQNIFNINKPSIVINLAAQAGVRYSINNPSSYVQSNLVGFANILELSRQFSVDHLIYASSSSVYGGNESLPFHEVHQVNHPISLYAATKKSNELMAHSYSHLYQIPITGLRFFTVYGPWGRPDMAPMIFAKSILNEVPIQIYNYGNMQRDFTFIDDIVEGVFKCSLKPASINLDFDKRNPDPSTSFAPYRLFNIGNNKPVELICFIDLLEYYLGKKAIREFKPLQPGDVISTAADTSLLHEWIQFVPSTSIEEGIDKFASWFKKFYC